MQHYMVEEQSASSLATSFPQTPSNTDLSIQAYLEDKLSSGYELVDALYGGSGATWRFVFRVVAK